jgi:hypothetical protein
MSSFGLIFERVVFNTDIISRKDVSFKEKCLQMRDITDENVKNMYVFYCKFISDSMKFQKPSSKDKIGMLRNFLDNRFVSHVDRDSVMINFAKAQRFYHAFNKFAFIYKLKKKEYATETDMYMNPINGNTKHALTIIHENMKYIFTYSDINKIIFKSLSNADNFYSEPMPIKNPYNNIPFYKSHLYYFYFSIKTSMYNVHKLFQYFFYSNFSMNLFLDKYECILRNDCIKNVDLSNKNICYDDIMEMIEIYNDVHCYEKIIIHDSFPKEYLINTFSPFLKYYYLSKYALCTKTKRDNQLYIDAILSYFNKTNPLYGMRLKRDTKLCYNHFYYNNEVSDINLLPIDYNKYSNDSHIKSFDLLNKFVSDYNTYSSQLRTNNNNHNNQPHPGDYAAITRFIENTILSITPNVNAPANYLQTANHTPPRDISINNVDNGDY